jgi:predicted ribosomally synthesized peptide with nif11-like leader
MTQKNAARIYKDVQQAEAEQLRQKALSEPENFIKLAAARGYNFSLENLETQLSQLSDEELAGIFNPGIPPRRHLYPK